MASARVHDVPDDDNTTCSYPNWAASTASEPPNHADNADDLTSISTTMTAATEDPRMYLEDDKVEPHRTGIQKNALSRVDENDTDQDSQSEAWNKADEALRKAKTFSDEIGGLMAKYINADNTAQGKKDNELNENLEKFNIDVEIPEKPDLSKYLNRSTKIYDAAVPDSTSSKTIGSISMEMEMGPITVVKHGSKENNPSQVAQGKLGGSDLYGISPIDQEDDFKTGNDIKTPLEARAAESALPSAHVASKVADELVKGVEDGIRSASVQIGNLKKEDESNVHDDRLNHVTDAPTHESVSIPVNVTTENDPNVNMNINSVSSITNDNAVQVPINMVSTKDMTSQYNNRASRRSPQIFSDNEDDNANETESLADIEIELTQASAEGSRVNEITLNVVVERKPAGESAQALSLEDTEVLADELTKAAVAKDAEKWSDQPVTGLEKKPEQLETSTKVSIPVTTAVANDIQASPIEAKVEIPLAEGKDKTMNAFKPHDGPDGSKDSVNEVDVPVELLHPLNKKATDEVKVEIYQPKDNWMSEGKNNNEVGPNKPTMVDVPVEVLHPLDKKATEDVNVEIYQPKDNWLAQDNKNVEPSQPEQNAEVDVPVEVLHPLDKKATEDVKVEVYKPKDNWLDQDGKNAERSQPKEPTEVDVAVEVLHPLDKKATEDVKVEVFKPLTGPAESVSKVEKEGSFVQNDKNQQQEKTTEAENKDVVVPEKPSVASSVPIRLHHEPERRDSLGRIIPVLAINEEIITSPPADYKPLGFSRQLAKKEAKEKSKDGSKGGDKGENDDIQDVDASENIQNKMESAEVAEIDKSKPPEEAKSNVESKTAEDGVVQPAEEKPNDTTTVKLSGVPSVQLAKTEEGKDIVNEAKDPVDVKLLEKEGALANEQPIRLSDLAGKKKLDDENVKVEASSSETPEVAPLPHVEEKQTRPLDEVKLEMGNEPERVKQQNAQVQPPESVKEVGAPVSLKDLNKTSLLDKKEQTGQEQNKLNEQVVEIKSAESSPLNYTIDKDMESHVDDVKTKSKPEVVKDLVEQEVQDNEHPMKVSELGQNKPVYKPDETKEEIIFIEQPAVGDSPPTQTGTNKLDENQDQPNITQEDPGIAKVMEEKCTTESTTTKVEKSNAEDKVPNVTSPIKDNCDQTPSADTEAPKANGIPPSMGFAVATAEQPDVSKPQGVPEEQAPPTTKSQNNEIAEEPSNVEWITEPADGAPLNNYNEDLTKAPVASEILTDVSKASEGNGVVHTLPKPSEVPSSGAVDVAHEPDHPISPPKTEVVENGWITEPPTVPQTEPKTIPENQWIVKPEYVKAVDETSAQRKKSVSFNETEPETTDKGKSLLIFHEARAFSPTPETPAAAFNVAKMPDESSASDTDHHRLPMDGSDVDLDEYERRLIANTREALALVDQLCKDSQEQQERRRQRRKESVAQERRALIAEGNDLDVETFKLNPELLGDPQSVLMLPESRLLILDNKLGLTLLDLNSRDVKRCAKAEDWRDLEHACFMTTHNQILLVYEERIEGQAQFKKSLARFDLDLNMLSKCEAPSILLDKPVHNCRVCHVAETDCIYLAVNSPSNCYIYELKEARGAHRWTEIYNMRNKQIADIQVFAVMAPVTQLLVIESTRRHLILLAIYESTLAERAMIAFCAEPAALCVDECRNTIVFDRATNLVGVHSRLHFERVRDLLAIGHANCQMSAWGGYLALLNKSNVELRICKY